MKPRNDSFPGCMIGCLGVIGYARAVQALVNARGNPTGHSAHPLDSIFQQIRKRVLVVRIDFVASCREDERRTIAGREQSVGALLVVEREHLLPLAAEGMDLAQTSFPTVNSLGCAKVLGSAWQAERDQTDDRDVDADQALNAPAPRTDPQLFPAQKLLSSGVVEGLNNKAKVTMTKSYGLRTFCCLELALYHSLWQIARARINPGFFGRTSFESAGSLRRESVAEHWPVIGLNVEGRHRRAVALRRAETSVVTSNSELSSYY